ncbi:glycoside hydrolase family 13 protein [Intestinibacter bartlettii]|uniref:Glycoside hydrolase family 13 protein n=1 Tax=Intestinibacter bartlettii TaxID=261299 RepID=A0ABS6DYC1_9FIRM|nr:glycoside hydrolase family 13 protein [Intestinibacter bartlettii]MBU5336848.1 glycoside hydrolase family 13 protein [Intestinibacter bartlettii]
MANIIRYNSWDTNFKAPFGALKTCETSKIKVESSKSLDVYSIKLIIEKEDENLNPVVVRELELKQTGETQELKEYSVEIAPLEQPATYYYFFVVELNLYGENKTLFYGKQPNNGMICEYNYENLNKYQLTVYEDYKVPSWFKEGVLYHVFVDRFNNGNRSGKVDNPKKNSFLYGNWDDDPMYIKDKNGEILRWDFQGGNLKGIINKLGYLKKLGVTVIYLSPIFEAASNHKYDTGNYKNIDPMFGDEKIFKELIDKAAEKGMSIVLDGVFSHVGADSIYFNKFNHYDSVGAYQSEDSPYRSWFNFKEGPEEYQSWWGIKALPNTNELEPSFMDYIIYDDDSVINKWMNMGVKGWRLDVADELPTKFIKELKKEARKNDEESIVIGEVWEDASNKISYGERRTYLLGDQLDSVLGYPFRDNLVSFLNGQISSWQLNDFFITIKENYPSEAFKSNLNLLSSHDIVRVKTALNSDKELLKLAILTQMSFEGVPYIYYGDEAGLEGGKDPENRKTYPWKNEDIEIMDFYRHCSQFRNRNKVFTLGDTYFVYTGNDDVFSYIRYNEDDTELVLINRSKAKQSVKLDIKADYLEEVTVTYSVINNGEKITTVDGKFNIDMDEKSYRIFKIWK